MRLKRLLYRYNAATAGEKLYLHLRSDFIDTSEWAGVGEALAATGRSVEFTDLFQQIAAISLAGRLVVAGVSFAERHPISDPQFEKSLREFVRDTIGESGDRLNRVCRFAEQAVIAAKKSPSQGQLNKFERWAERNHPHCYMCRATLDFTRTHQFFTYTCEHIWPQMYGGDSTTDNFLPACIDCNSRVKRDFATWSQVNVQSLILGLAPKPKNLQSIDNVYNFAMHHRIAQRYAAMHNQNLRWAFMQIGPWTEIRVLTPHDTGDFFNLMNHDPLVVLD